MSQEIEDALRSLRAAEARLRRLKHLYESAPKPLQLARAEVSHAISNLEKYRKDELL